MPQDRNRLLERARGIRALALDIDGVLTDASLFYGSRGDSLKAFSARDGFAIKLAQSEGIDVAILTGRTAGSARSRVADLGIPARLAIHGSRDKRADVARLARRLGVDLAAVAYMGDDIPDLPALTTVGLAACPADASEEVRRRCQFVAGASGGHGAVRELIQLLLEARGRWNDIVDAWASGTAAPAFFKARPRAGGRGRSPA